MAMRTDTPEGNGGPQGNKLYRNSADGMIAGVCAGVADYFGFDLTVTRVLVVIGAFMFPMIVVLYIALALLLKKRPNGRLAFDEKTTELRRKIRAEPHATLASVRHRFRDLDIRLQRLEKYVTSERFKLDREFEGLKD
jgi:phage shock protein C